MNYKGKNVLVTGGTGMIGRFLVKELLEREANVKVCSLDDASLCPEGAEFVSCDLTKWENCLDITKGMDIVFHLAGIKGSPVATQKRPASFFTPMILFNTNMLEASRVNKVNTYLYTSSIGVYSPESDYKEDEMWNLPPSPNDWYAGWAKRMGELQVEAYKKQYRWNDIFIVRPANVYGEFDNFSDENSMVIPSLVKRVLTSEDTLTVWGDGSAIRDFIHGEDVARGMLHVVENRILTPVNLGSGTGYTIKELVEKIIKASNKNLKIEWDISKPSGDPKRVLDTKSLRATGFNYHVNLEDGVSRVLNWYKEYQSKLNRKSYF